jgi:YD repeat-containing protein
MMIYWVRVVFFVFLLPFLLAEEADYSLVNLTRSPIPKVAGNVNIVTGNWVDQSTHHVTSGPDPYVIGHSYISSSLEEGTLADGWDMYHPSELSVYQPEGIRYVRKSIGGLPLFFENSENIPFFNLPELGTIPCFQEDMTAKDCQERHQCVHKSSLKKPDRPPRDPKAETYPLRPKNNVATLTYRESGGATYVFKGDGEAKHFYPKIHKSGYNHISSIETPTRRDIKRTTVRWDKNHDEWIVILGDGTKRFYSRANQFRHCPLREEFPTATYHIREEVLPSGNRRWYHYSSDNDLKSIQTVSSDRKYVLHYVEFHRRHNDVEVKTSEGIATRFSLKKIHENTTAHIVESIHQQGQGNTFFTYCSKSDHHSRRIYEKTIGNGRKDIVRFYHEGKNEVGSEKVFIRRKEDKNFYKDRVREIWTKQNPSEHHLLSHTFTYKDWDTHAKASVTESDGALTEYIWDTEQRPTWIGFTSQNGRRLRSEHFTWGHGHDEGRLLRRTHLDESSKPLLDHEYEFDDDGNVVREHLRGEFTSEAPLRMDDDRKIHDGDTLTWKAQYTRDGRHLKKAEVDPLGNWTYYEYEDNRCLMTAKFICDKDRIIRREFYDYDSAANCIKTSSDDGSSRSRHNLSNVTRKTTKEIKPRYSIPNFGAPEEEIWSIWTPGYGKQITRIDRYTRDSFGRTTLKELIDGFGLVQKRWTYAYDHCHRVTESCDPSGRIEKFSYDDSGRLESKTASDASTYYTYDLFDRVIEVKRVFPDGSSSVRTTQYDLTGRVKTIIDERGRRTKSQLKSII